MIPSGVPLICNYPVNSASSRLLRKEKRMKKKTSSIDVMMMAYLTSVLIVRLVHK
jgi:hypothetical protein